MSDRAFMRMKKLTGAGIVLAAARHNRRTIACELAVSDAIDPSRIHLNETLHGPDTPEEVANLAKHRMESAQVGKLRKDAVRALELVFSLPTSRLPTDERAYFERCWRWCGEEFGGQDNILSVDIHRDEAAPHCHVLVLPLLNGRMVGSDMMGSPAALKSRQARFLQQVAGMFGFSPSPERMSTGSRQKTARAVLNALQQRHDPVLLSELWPAIRDTIEDDPLPFAHALGVLMNTPTRRKRVRTMAEIFTSKGKGPAREQNPIGFRPSPLANHAADECKECMPLTRS